MYALRETSSLLNAPRRNISGASGSKMSCANEIEAGDVIVVAEARMLCCASCAIPEVGDVKLKICDGCDLVRYCSDACQEYHRSEHEAKCKERAAELRDELLFKQPEGTHLGDCPLCCVPIPIGQDKSSTFSCCGKWICKGCAYADIARQWEENKQRTCPFCRHPLPKTDEELTKNKMKRAERNDPVALSQMGELRHKERDYQSAFEYFTRAADLGDADSHYNLSIMYSKEQGVEKDEKKVIYHLEKASIAGCPQARHNLACIEGKNCKFDRAVKHLIINANLGFDLAIQELKICYKYGLVSKDDFAAALRAHHAAVDAFKSPQREVAAAANFR